MNAFQLKLDRELPAPVERVFQAWTRPELLARWFGPGTVTTESAAADATPGGGYRVEMRAPDGSTHTPFGFYHEVNADERLVFTWQWEGGDAVTLVKVNFDVLDANLTKLELTHTGFEDDEVAQKHVEGWSGSLEKLLALFTH